MAHLNERDGLHLLNISEVIVESSCIMSFNISARRCRHSGGRYFFEGGSKLFLMDFKVPPPDKTVKWIR